MFSLVFGQADILYIKLFSLQAPLLFQKVVFSALDSYEPKNAGYDCMLGYFEKLNLDITDVCVLGSDWNVLLQLILRLRVKHTFYVFITFFHFSLFQSYNWLSRQFSSMLEHRAMENDKHVNRSRPFTKCIASWGRSNFKHYPYDPSLMPLKSTARG